MKKLLPFAMILMTASAAQAGGIVSKHASSVQLTVDAARTQATRIGSSFSISGSNIDTTDGNTAGTVSAGTITSGIYAPGTISATQDTAGAAFSFSQSYTQGDAVPTSAPTVGQVPNFSNTTSYTRRNCWFSSRYCNQCWCSHRDCWWSWYKWHRTIRLGDHRYRLRYIMDRLKEAIGLGLILGAFHGAAQAVPVVPNFTQGSMTSHTETTQKITETINSMDYSTGYQYSATGSGVSASGNLSPGTGSNNVTINGVTSSWTGVTSKPSFVQTNPGAAFQFTETYSGPGLQNHTVIQRVTEVTSVTDTTSIFSQ